MAKKKIILANIILIVAIIITALILLLITRTTNKQSKSATIWYQNNIVKTIDLNNVDGVVEEDIALDENITIIISYKNGAIRVLSAPCHTHDCVKTGWSSSSRKPIICLDLGYKIVLSDQDEVDVVV